MKKDTIRISLIAGAIGIAIGAASMQAATQILDASIYSRPSVRSLKIEGQENMRDRQGEQREDVVYPTNAIK